MRVLDSLMNVATSFILELGTVDDDNDVYEHINMSTGLRSVDISGV